jgi:hypothetical protein
MYTIMTLTHTYVKNQTHDTSFLRIPAELIATKKKAIGLGERNKLAKFDRSMPDQFFFFSRSHSNT